MAPATPHTSLSQAVSFPKLRTLLESFHQATQVPLGIRDSNNNWLLQLGWQPICSQFHRQHPETAQLCLSSDRTKTWRLPAARFVSYPCLTGLVDVTYPILSPGNDVGTHAVGQFLELEPNYDFFREQARRYGFDEEAYLASLAKVPVRTAEDVAKTMTFLTELIALVISSAEESERRVSAEARLAALKRSMEERVAARTADLEDAINVIQGELSVDHLTATHNRRTLDSYLSQQIEQGCSGLCLLMVDVDRFKGINDSYGHLVGDQVLRTVADSVQQVLRGGDFLARWGGDEFVVVLANTGAESAYRVAQRIRASIPKQRGPAGRVTVSIGLARWQGEPAETLLKRADFALYQAKSAGRDRIAQAGLEVADNGVVS